MYFVSENTLKYVLMILIKIEYDVFTTNNMEDYFLL